MAEPRALSDSFEEALDNARILQAIIPDQVFSLDPAGLILSFFCNLPGHRSLSGSISGKHISEILSRNAWAAISRAGAVARVTGQVQSTFYEVPTAVGVYFHEAQVHLRRDGGATVLVRDISSSKAEEARSRLQAEEARAAAQREADQFRRLFDGASVLAAIFSLDGRILEANAAFLREIGCDLAELQATPIVEFIHPEDRAKAASLISDTIQGQSFQGVEFRALRKDGSSLWISVNTGRDPRHDVFYSVSTDISERKMREQQALDRLRMMEMAEAMGGIGFWRVDVQSLEVDWSPEVYRIHGLLPDQHYPALDAWFWLFSPEDRPAVLHHLHRIIHHDEPAQIELSLQGTPRRVVLFGRRVVDEGGRVTHLFGAIQDISRQRASEVELRRLAAVANLTLNGVVITNPQGEIEWVNASFERITGYSLREVTGKRPGRLLQGPETDRYAVALARQRIRDKQGFKIELVNYRKSGEKYWVEIEVQPFFNTDGELIHFIGIETDISERKSFEDQLIAAREAAIEGSRVKSQFLANMSHEIRTPLNGVLGAARLLASSGLSGEQRELLDAVILSGSTLLATINDILDISKIEAGKLDLEIVPFPLSTTVEEIVRSFLPLTAPKNIDLSCSIAPNLPAWVLGDPVRFRQIFNNLLSNAVKFTPSGSISVSLVRGEGGAVVGSVRDTGIGIPPERRAIIFDPFTQADGSTTRNFGGSGLGLSICRELVSRMGGDIRFDSSLGAGTTFSFSVMLPETLAPVLPLVAPQRSQLPLRSLRVLVAEDNPTNAFIVGKVLKKLGHLCKIVGNGRLALDALDADPWDVVLMDVQMPVMDGLEATRAIRARSLRVPVIMLTANAMKGDAERCLEAGADAYLPKPIDNAALVAALAGVCS